MTYPVAVAVSGRGSNLRALHEDLQRDGVAEIAVVIADRDAPALAWARERGMATHQFADPRDPAEWLATLAAHDAELVVLAGYLRLVPAGVVAAWTGRIINVHPALLPQFGGKGMHGMHVHRAVLAAGAAESGATVHLVDAVYDRGEILGQGRVTVPADATPESLADAVLAVEHRLLPAAVRAASRARRPVPFTFE